MKISKLLILGTLAASLVMITAAPVSALDDAHSYNMTYRGAQDTVNGAIINAFTPTDSTGTGYWHSFLRVSAANQSIVKGYNSDYKKNTNVQFNEDPSWTQSFLLEDVPRVQVGGAGPWYREFQLDINQNSNGTDALISIDELEIWLTDTWMNDAKDTADTSIKYPFTDDAAMHFVWRLDGAGDSVILTNFGLNPGSGKRDFKLLVPDSLFDDSYTYIVLYTEHGGDEYTGPYDLDANPATTGDVVTVNNTVFGNNDGFEEWGVAIYPPTPAISITKSADIEDFCLSEAPYPVTYTYLVENTGNDDLENVDLTDDTCGTPSYSSGDDGDGLLNPGEIWTYTCSTDLDGTTTNHVVVTAVGVDSDTTVTANASATVTAFDVAVTVDPTDAEICAGDDPVQFCAVVTLGSGDYSYSWTKDGGAPFATTQCITVGEAGEYCVTVTDNVTGCEDTACATLLVNDVAVEVDPSEATICQGGEQEFCAVVTLGSGDYSYSWTKDGGDPFATTQCITVSEAGEYCVTVTDNVTGCKDNDTACATLTVVSPPQCSIDGLDEVCEDDTDISYCSHYSAERYSWSIEGNGTIVSSTDQQCVTVDAGAEGSFTLTLVVCNGPVELECCSQCTYEVTVNPCQPGIDVEKYADIDDFCLTGVLPVPVTYTYYVTATGDEDLENVSLEDLDCTPVRQADAPGNDDDVLDLGEVWVYTCSTDLYDTTTNTVEAVGYGVFSQERVTDSDSATVTAYDVAVTVDPAEATICQGGEQEFCAVVTLGSGDYSYSWTKDGGDPFATTQCITVSEAGEYCVAVLDNITGCIADDCATLTVNPPPECSIVGLETVCEGSSNQYCGPAGMASYAWVITSGDASIPGAKNEQCASVVAGAAGLFTIELTIVDQADCENTCSLEVTVESCGGAFCTFTQGFYGNMGGKGCGGVKTADLIDALLLQDGPVVVGGGGNQISLETSECIIDLLPAGGTAGPIDPAGNYYCDDVGDNLDPDLLGKQGRFDNVLIGQVVALTLNLRLYDYGCNDGGDLGGWELPAEFCTLGKNGCPKKHTMSISGITVEELLALANDALAGEDVSPYSISDINSAVDGINEAFDECKEVVSCGAGVEICGNGCDDDFDGLVDSADVIDCPPIILP